MLGLQSLRREVVAAGLVQALLEGVVRVLGLVGTQMQVDSSSGWAVLAWSCSY